MTADLTQRITAAMDEAEKLADAAIDDMTESDYFAGDDSPAAWTLGVTGGLGGPVGEHAAFWSPDRVLALIAADRRVLARHQPVDKGRVESCCQWCCQAIRCCPWPCPDMRDLAARWVTS